MLSEGLLTIEIKEALEEIVEQCFYNNRIADRIASLLSVQFVMPATEKIIHSKYAHLMPILADVITDYMSARDCSAIYGETPIGNQEYNTPLDCFQKLLEINLELESKTKKAIDVVMEQKDYVTKVELDSFLKSLIPITNSLLTLVDKAENYNKLEDSREWMSFDKDVHIFNLFED